MPTESTPPTVLKTWMRGCAIVMGVLAVYLLLSGTFSWWRLLLAALLLACPVLTLWLGWTYARPGRAAIHPSQTDAKGISHES